MRDYLRAGFDSIRRGVCLAVVGGAVVGLTWAADPFLIRDIRRATNGPVAVTFDSDSQHLFEVQLLTNLQGQATARVLDTLIGQDPRTTWTDLSAAGPIAPRYYRARRLSFTGDEDNDTLNNLAEFQLGTDLHRADTDGDSLTDGWEARYALDPLSGAGDNGAAGDPDGDGVINQIEFLQGRNPTRGVVTNGHAAVGLEVYTPWE